jgi:hypothetical protein
MRHSLPNTGIYCTLYTVHCVLLLLFASGDFQTNANPVDSGRQPTTILERDLISSFYFSETHKTPPHRCDSSPTVLLTLLILSVN